MIAPNKIIEAARAYLGTPYMHWGRQRGRALDCIGLIILVARDVGAENAFSVQASSINYAQSPDPEKMGRDLRSTLDEVSKDEMQLGDILWFRIPNARLSRSFPQHVGIVGTHAGGGFSIIHAYSPTGCVVEHVLDDKWARRINSVFRFRSA
jgi:cell wall-associated NlpC family hydrolase